MEDILKPSVNDPRGERLIADILAQDLTALSVDDLQDRITSLKTAIHLAEQALDNRQGASAAAEALFKI